MMNGELQKTIDFDNFSPLEIGELAAVPEFLIFLFFSISHFLLSNYYRAGRCSAFFSSLKLLHFPLINGRAPSKVHYFLFFFLFYFKLPPFSFLSKTKLAIFFFFKRNYLAKLHSLLIKRNYLAKLHSLLINAYHSCCQG